MKHIFIFIFIFCFQQMAVSQQLDYKPYYEMCFNAEYDLALNKKNEAWKKYNHAFKLFFPQISNLNKAISLGEELFKEDKTIRDELLQLINFRNTFFPEGTILKKSLNKKEEKQLLAFFPYLNKKDFEPMNSQKLENTIKLCNFLYLDQSVRKVKNNSCKDSLLIHIDKKIYEEFLPYLKNNGFPSQREYGMIAIYPHFLLLHITARSGVTEEIQTLLLDQIKKGNYHPSAYARLIDRHRAWIKKEPQLYGEWVEKEQIGDIYDIQNIDLRRAEIGIEPFYEFCLKNNYQLPPDYIIPEKYKK